MRQSFLFDMVKLRALPPNSIISNGDGMLESRIDQPGFIAWKFDPNNTRSWNRIKKWKATITACYMSSLISVAASAYSQAMDGIQADLHSSHLLTVSGISFFTFAVAIFPTILAPLGEQFGRRPVYVITFALFFLSFIPNALAQNIQTVLISRFICGAMGSAGSTMVGGTLSDIWEPEERQVPMALFALSALLGTPMGLIGFSWAGGLTSWRWIFWVMLILAAPSFLVILLFFRQESLTREMREKIRQLQMSAEADQNSSFGRNSKRMLKPLFFLATEPITLMLSLWIAFAWGTLYLFLESVPMVFAPYGFTHDNKSRGLSFAGIGIGALIGFALHILILRTRKPVTKPEQRLFEACIGAIVFPVGFFFSHGQPSLTKFIGFFLKLEHPSS